MKRINYCLLGLGMLLAMSCTKTQTQSKNEIPVVDVTKTYPKKEIVLQDIAEVDYIPLETSDDVLIDNTYHLYYISPDSLLVGNYLEGSVFLFNGQGKLLKKFNHKGQSGEEYQAIWGIYYDKPTEEILVLDHIMKYQFQVYDVKGNYKRTLPIAKKYNLTKFDVINYDENSLLCSRNGNLSGLSFGNSGTKSDSVKKEIIPYFFISKKDGKELGDLPIFLPKKAETTIINRNGNSISMSSADLRPLLWNEEVIILSEASKDTIFTYSKDKKLEPIVLRTPEILKMDEPLVFLQIEKLTSKYIFGKTIKKGTKKNPEFTDQRIVIDRATNEVYECDLINADSPEEDLFTEYFLKNDQTLFLEADLLKELLEAGELKGKLKDIAEKIKEDDNPVWVRVKFKN